MTIRYEANPPKILPNVDVSESSAKFLDRIRLISTKCDAIHLTENVLGHQRVSPIEIGKKIRNEIPHLPITVSLRVRDKSEKEIDEAVENCIAAGFSGILVLMGDPSQIGEKDSGQIPSKTVKRLRENGIDSKIDLYLSISNIPDLSKIGGKLDANPKGFMTQVVHTTQQVQNLASNLKGYSVIPIILFPSNKNEKSANFLNLDLSKYSKTFTEFVSESYKITGDVLLSSPNDFTGLNEFLEKSSI